MCVCILLMLFLVKIVNWFRWTNVLYFRLCHDSGHWPLATEGWRQCQARPCVICGGSSDSETGFSLIIFIFPS